VLISNGSIGGFTDTDLLIPGPDDLHLVNADGLTRWWNPSEFPMNGTIFGYTDGLLGTPYSMANYSATLNGYKYFCDDLADPHDPMSDVDPTRRGIFSAGQKNVRHYTIDMGTTGLIFNYAIDASWTFPLGPPPWEVPDDFPPEANRPEAWNVSTGIIENTMWNDGVDSGGDLSLQIDVYDWFNGELNLVTVESPGNFTAVQDVTPSGGGVGYSTYYVDIEAATPAPSAIDILISVKSEFVGYGDLLPGKTQAAYFMTAAPVDDEAPPVEEWPEEWSCFQYNAANIGRNPNEQGFDPLSYTQLWYAADSGLKYAGPAITENHAYTCANSSFYSNTSHHITCFSMSDGSIAWQHYINPNADYGRAHTSPCYYDDGGDGRIIVGGDRVYCFNAVTGSIIWEYGETDFAFVRHSPKIYNDRVFIAGAGAGLGTTMHCIDIDTGSEIWVGGASLCSYEVVPAVVDGRVYFGGPGGNYVCMDADSDTPDVLWEVNYNGMTTHWNAPLVMDERLYYAASYDERLLCLDTNNGDRHWSFEDPDPETVTVWLTALTYWDDPVDEKRIVCFGEAYAAGGVRAVKDQGDHGELVWQYHSGSLYVDASPVYCEGYVYIGSTTDDAIHVIDAATGGLAAAIPLSGDPRGAVGFAYGRLIATTSSGVYCFE
jgi:YVTN family beta-propeller protein